MIKAIPLTPRLQRALQASSCELEVVDPSTNQHYFVVAKDRWLERTSAQPERAGSPSPRERDADSAEPWTDDKNRRRAELVDRQIAGSLTNEERSELDVLQQEMRAYRELVAPLPLEDTRKLHAELMAKARRAQARKA